MFCLLEGPGLAVPAAGADIRHGTLFGAVGGNNFAFLVVMLQGGSQVVLIAVAAVALIQSVAPPGAGGFHHFNRIFMHMTLAVLAFGLADGTAVITAFQIQNPLSAGGQGQTQQSKYFKQRFFQVNAFIRYTLIVFKL